jgi:cytochrome c biogenesis factor
MIVTIVVTVRYLMVAIFARLRHGRQYPVIASIIVVAISHCHCHVCHRGRYFMVIIVSAIAIVISCMLSTSPTRSFIPGSHHNLSLCRRRP